MAGATISQIKVGNTTYDIHDAVVDNLETRLSALESSVVKYVDPDSTGYGGLARSTGTDGYSDTGWFRTPASGLIPHTQNSNGNGQIGTSTWPFSSVTAKTLNGALAATNITGTLSADRIPTLAIGTKTSGTLARNRGGTGVTQVTSGTVTPQNSTTFTTHACYHNGIVATIHLKGITLANNLASGSGVVIGTVPAGFLPNNEAFAMICDPNKMYVGLYCRITTDGELRLYNYAYLEDTIPKNRSLGAATFTYVTKTA